MPRPIVKIRTQAAQKQQFRCFYCNLPMWDKNPDHFMSTYGLTPKQARLLRCTAEHLHPRSEGGPDSSDNIVAACAYCNQRRHKSPRPMDPSKYKQHIRQRMQRGKWSVAIFNGNVDTLLQTSHYHPAITAHAFAPVWS